ncbi:hypothetical protein [Pimelobacter sp. 30-1]|uniref:hypothetical protein n=1 Tax=Pimelobacter sp. 30-1 TaxID=2004991 RepID=UPI001C04850E|nr:hypothetical protein [Pimelobacter sp. 30-1]MBU2696769.1 hypothetical protein [Pimelobacter sp. 30-1]
MNPARRLGAVLALALAGSVAGIAPASAATPTFAVTSGPYEPRSTVGFLGSGCPASSPISIDVWDTAKPSSHVNLDHWTNANSAGAFGTSIDLDDRFDRGAQVGFFVSCTSTVDWNAGAALVTTPRYGWINLPDPAIAIDAPAGATVGTTHRVVVRTDSVLGGASLSLDGAPLPFRPDSVYGWWVYELPATLAAGDHALHATWSPSAPGSPTVSADATYRVAKERPGLAERVDRRRVGRGGVVKVRVGLSAVGTVARTGRVVVRDGRRVVGRLTLGPSGASTRALRVRLNRPGKHRLTATFTGNADLSAVRSPALTVRVRR